MITKDYQENRKQVLTLYKEYKNNMDKIGKTVGENISSEAKKIEKEIFNLMVLGEAKSGKSTFINAYLGKEVVPMDVRQCTSAIIKIRRGDSFKLKAKRADGNVIQRKGEEEISEFLKQNAAISDQYRSIPITYLNNELLIKKRGKITEEDVIKAAEELKDDNINHLEPDEYKGLIQKYIYDHKDQWYDIITEIEITYPLPEQMQGITIIDSPGVSARGHVGKITEDYIQKTNAIIFVKYLKGQALESSSFTSLLSKSTKQNQEMMFLVFTGKADFSGKDFDSLREQALEMYKNVIQEEKIIFVDSKAQLFLHKCTELGTREKIDQFFEKLKEENNGFDPAKVRWLESDKEIDVYTEAMEELSDFNGVQSAIEKFALTANYIQLLEFVESMSQEYRRYKSIFTQTRDIAEENLNDPNTLEYNINQKKDEIADTYNKIKEGVDEVEAKYTDPVYSEGIINREAKKKADHYKRKLAEFKNIPSQKITVNTFEKLKAMTFNSIDDTKKFRREMADKLVKECNEKLIQYLDDPTGVEADAYVPNFNESDFDAMADQASKAADKEKTETKSFGLIEKKVPYHDYKYQVECEIKGIEHNIDQIINDLIDNVVTYTRKCAEMYTEKLIEHYEELEGELEKLLRDKENNEKLLKDIEKLTASIEIVENGNRSAVQMKGVLKNYVGSCG